MKETAQQLQQIGQEILRRNPKHILYINYAQGLIGIQKWSSACLPGEEPSMKIVYPVQQPKK